MTRQDKKNKQLQSCYSKQDKKGQNGTTQHKKVKTVQENLNFSKNSISPIS